MKNFELSMVAVWLTPYTCLPVRVGTLHAGVSNNYGQLGVDTHFDSNIPLQKGTDTDWCSAADDHFPMSVRQTDGTLWA